MMIVTAYSPRRSIMIERGLRVRYVPRVQRSLQPAITIKGLGRDLVCRCAAKPNGQGEWRGKILPFGDTDCLKASGVRRSAALPLLANLARYTQTLSFFRACCSTNDCSPSTPRSHLVRSAPRPVSSPLRDGKVGRREKKNQDSGVGLGFNT